MSKETDLEENEKELWKLAGTMGISIATDIGVGKILQYVFGSGAGFVGTVLGMFRSFLDAARNMAQARVRKEYGNEKIYVMGQQVATALTSEEIWAFVNRVGGVVWVQDVPITRGDALARVVFWHADHAFALAKNVIRVYRSVGSQCVVSDYQGAVLRAAE